MKRLAALGLVFVLMFSFTGCKGDIELNKEDNDHVAEYIAGVLLKYSYENEWEYQKLKNSALTNYQNSVSGRTQTSSGNTKANSGSKNTASTSGSISQTGSAGTSQSGLGVMEQFASALGLDNAQITYKTYQSGDRYPTDEYSISVPAKSGCKVVALEFEIKNNGSSQITANTSSKGVSIKLTVGDKTVAESATLLKNDILQLKNVSINAGSSYTAAAIFQVPESNISAISGATAVISVNGASIGTRLVLHAIQEIRAVFTVILFLLNMHRQIHLKYLIM